MLGSLVKRNMLSLLEIGLGCLTTVATMDGEYPPHTLGRFHDYLASTALEQRRIPPRRHCSRTAVVLPACHALK